MAFGAMAAIASLALAAPSATVPGVRELPFEIASNKPFVRVSINGSPRQWFILDTGCAGTSVVAKECAERIGLAGRDETRTQLGAGEGVQVGVATASDVTLDMGGTTMTAPELRIFPLGHVAPFEGRRVDGLIGQDFLERYVVEIDYARSRIRIHDPDRFDPPAGAMLIPITLEGGLAVAAGSLRLGARGPRSRSTIPTRGSCSSPTPPRRPSSTT
jgi:predicted aspartyl protease